jgi:hypothetical protein
MTDGQTLDQDPEGEGGGEGQQAPQMSEEEVRLSKENADLQKNLSDLSRSLRRAEGEAKTHQSRADRLATAMVNKPAGQNVSPKSQGRVRPRRQQQQVQQVEPEGEEDQLTALADYANETAKEAALLKEVLNRGLSLDDVEDIEFSDPSELTLRLDVIQQQKEIDDLKKSIAAQEDLQGAQQEGGAAQTGETSSTVQIDTGGQSGSVGDRQVLRADELRKKARELRAEGKYKEATWLALRASHVDPNKVINVETPGEEF